MAKINVCRTNMELPTGNVLEGVRAFLFGAVDGASKDDQRAWRAFWRRMMNLSPGEIAQAEMTIPRNGKFHRKFFALLSLGFDSWEPDRKRKSYKGREVAKNFEQFREDITILAGYYVQTFDLKGRMTLKAQSISFANMDDIEFERLYSAVADVLLREVCKNYKNREEIDRVVNQIVGFF
ncbi:MAG: DUF1367 family protein [Nitrosospira sp.]